MASMRKHIDGGFGLFVVALFVKGFAHEMLLEAGVLPVSVKL